MAEFCSTWFYRRNQGQKSTLAFLASFAALVLAMLTLSDFTRGQDLRDPQVRLNLRGETSLSTLVEYISQRLALRFVYEESLVQKKIVLQLPDEVPVSSLFDLLQSALQISGYAITKTGDPTVYRIVSNDKISTVAIPSGSDTRLEGYEKAIPLTKVFPLRRADPSQIRLLIQPFLTNPGASTIPLPANRSIIVVDTASNLMRVEKLIEILDEDRFNSTIQFVKVKHLNATSVADQLTQILSSRARTEIGAAMAPSDGSNGSKQSVLGLEIAADERSNQLILVGIPTQLESALELLRILDVPLASESQSYNLQFITPIQAESLLTRFIESVIPTPPFSTRSEGNTLIVDTTPEIHKQISRLLLQIDSRDASTKQNPIRFYKIKNVPVQDLMETLNTLQGGFSPGLPLGGTTNFVNASNRPRTTNDRAIPGRNIPNIVTDQTAQPGIIPPVPPAIRNGLLNNAINYPDESGGGINDGQRGLGGMSPSLLYGVNPVLGVSPTGFSPLISGVGIERGIQSPLGAAQVTADLGSNSLIIIAEPEVQQAYEQLIQFLDKRRPQVMIEARIVIVDTTGDFTLGVEVSGGNRSGLNRLFAFSNYGLSTVNPVTGNLLITPGDGLNATLVDPSTADFVVRALTNHRRARVLSAPKLLVDDNAEGTLESVSEVPFTSVNASQTVATTSFAGFAKAGTTITVTPTISEAKHVSLDYLVTLNSFTGTGSDGVPPPRQTNEVRSRVTVPDGYTIIVGGLTQKNVVNDYKGIPYLETIPVIRELTGLTASSHKDNALFIFLRPIILEDDKFRDLRDVSHRHANVAHDGFDFPASSPQVMHR
jgi:type II secretory pathway component GspD/PulD (secretin)